MSLLLGTHRPGTTWLHRLPAGPKLLGLMVVSVLVVLVRGPASAVVALVVSGVVTTRHPPIPGPDAPTTVDVAVEGSLRSPGRPGSYSAVIPAPPTARPSGSPNGIAPRRSAGEPKVIRESRPFERR